jgi:hypothetical protein
MKFLATFSFLSAFSSLATALPAANEPSALVPRTIPTPSKGVELASVDASGVPEVVFVDDPGSVGGGNAPSPKAVIGDSTSSITNLAPLTGWLQWTHNWDLGSVTGNHLIKFYQDGRVQFKTHFHAGGLWGYNYALTCALRDSAGHVYTLQRQGTVHGTFSPGSRDHDVDQTTTNANVKTYWANIKASPLMHCKVK